LCAALALAATGARAEDCAPAAGLRLSHYRAVFLECRNDAGEPRLATRAMDSGDGPLLLTVDPQRLTTRLARAACWRCAPTSDAEQADTRFLRALHPAEDAIRPAVLKNAGLLHGRGDGSFVTGDLCPSRKPLDRGFLERLAREQPGAPVALAVSGYWMQTHRADLTWLKSKATEDALAITWVNHSYTHPYRPGRSDAQTYLLTPGIDLDRETLGVERVMIENGVTPSVFFRFPGLVADDGLMDKIRARHLVALGADSWIALGPPPRPGSIVLVHPNGNEPQGLALFERLLGKGRVPKPFRPIDEAP